MSELFGRVSRSLRLPRAMCGSVPCMGRPWAFLLLLVGAVASLVSLYLPWQRASCDADCLREQGKDVALRNLFAEDLTVDGWSSGVGEAAALLALLLAAVAMVALARPNLTDRLPLGLCALLVGYFGFAKSRSVVRWSSPVSVIALASPPPVR